MRRGELRPNLDRLTVGVDLGDQWSHYCILGLEGETLAEGQLRTTPQDVTEFFAALNVARVVVEVGTHSAWVREVICGYGHEVLVANPRLMEGSKRRKRKNDRIDANKLARLGRVDPQSLHPMQHRSPGVRQDLVMLRARDALVAARTELINATRGLVKSMGARLPKCSSPSFAQKVEEAVPAEIQEALLPLVRMTAALSDSIQGYDEKIEKLSQREVWAYDITAAGEGGGTDHGAGLRFDLGESRAICEESRCGTVSGIGAEAGRLGREPAAIRNQQSRRYDGAPAVGGERAVYLGAVRTRHGLTTVWAAALRARREECEEASGGRGGTEAGGVTAPAVGERRGV